MARSPRKVFSKTYNTSNRRNSIDYDYVDSLGKDEQEWLAKFTDEYYCASFDYNDAYMTQDLVISTLINQLSTSDNEKKSSRIHKQISYYANNTDVVQDLVRYCKVSNNDNEQLNIDLRKVRKCPIFYMANGKLSEDRSNKYSDTNIHPESLQKACNANVESNGRDILAKECNVEKMNGNDFSNTIEEYSYSELSMEDMMILREEIEERIDKL